MTYDGHFHTRIRRAHIAERGRRPNGQFEAAGRLLDGVTAPTRIQLSRRHGWRMPAGAVKVDRSTRWGNPWPVGAEGPLGRTAPDAEGAVGLFEQMLRDPQMRAAAGYPSDLSPLRGKALACWCRVGDWCHADVLLRLANEGR